jgi:hypothetical protein
VIVSEGSTPSDRIYQEHLMAKKPERNAKTKPGPKAETLKIEGMGWEQAVKKSFQKKKPAGGWPK